MNEELAIKLPAVALIATDKAEREFMASKLERCEACGHLELNHNAHCCEFCLVPDCQCKWGAMPDGSEA